MLVICRGFSQLRFVSNTLIYRLIVTKKNNAYSWSTKTSGSFAVLSSLHSKTLPDYAYKCRKFHTTVYSNNLVSFNLSDIGEGIREVIVKEWFVKEGDRVLQFDDICEVQSDKASVTITSRYDGVVVKLYHKIDDIAFVGKPLLDIQTDDADDNANAKEGDLSSSSSDDEVRGKKIPIPKEHTIAIENSKIFTIPSVRRIARENKIELSQVKGTGKDGRILKEDVIAFINKPPEKATRSSTDKDIQLEPIRGYTRTMIKTMTEAMKIPHFLYCDEISVLNIIKLREQVNKHLQKDNFKISYMPFIVKAISNSLLRHPIINAQLDYGLQNILYSKNHNIGIAMDTVNGLVVPNIKNVENLTIIDIARELKRLQHLGQTNKFTYADLSDGTFTISNIGSIGGTYAKPIILPNQSAIIALGAFKKVPRYDKNDAIIPDVIMNVSASADHRLIDGATMANFCNMFKKQIEDPYLLFLNI